METCWQAVDAKRYPPSLAPMQKMAKARAPEGTKMKHNSAVAAAAAASRDQ